MKTTTFGDVLNQAAELAQRTRDKIPISEQIMLQGFLATEFGMLVTAQCWPELIPDFLNVVNITNNQFPIDENSADPTVPEIGDILAILSQNPHVTDHWRHVAYSVGDDVIYLEDSCASVWVEYMLPYPGATFPDLAPGVMTLPNFLAATLPRRWRNLLAHKTAAHLYGADNNAAAAGVQFGLANAALGAELMRLPPVPAWRGCHMPLPKRRHYGSPVMWF